MVVYLQHSTAAISIFSMVIPERMTPLTLRKLLYYLGFILIYAKMTVPYLLSGVSKVFVLTRLDRCGLCRGCEWVWFRALSKWSSVSGVRHTRGVLLHLSPLLQRPLVQPALWPLWPPPQSLPEQLHLPDTLQWNSLLQMPSWWVSAPPQPHTNSVGLFFFSPFFEYNYTILFNRLLHLDNLHSLSTLKVTKNTNSKITCKSYIKRFQQGRWKILPVTVKHASFVSPLWNVRGFPKSHHINRDNKCCFLVHESYVDVHLRKKTTVKVFLHRWFKGIKCIFFLTMIDTYKKVRLILCRHW